MAPILPSAQANKGDEYLKKARDLRDQWGQLIPGDDLTALQNRMTMATDLRHGLDEKFGVSKIVHARMYRKYARETLRVMQTTSDRARDAEYIALAHEPHDEQEQRVIRKAEAIYRTFFGYKDAFPSPEQKLGWQKAVWPMACQATGTNIAPPSNLAEVLADVGPRFFTDVKKKVTPLVERFYGFETSKAQESLNDNITNVQNLKTNSAFINDDRGQRLPYRHPVIQKAVNIIWFNDRSSDGIAFYNNFNPMPYEAIALVLAVIECCIDEWTKGSWAEIPFTYEDYKGVYHHHLEALKALTSQGLRSRQCDPLHKLRQDISNEGRRHAGIVSENTGNEGILQVWPQERVNAACNAAMIELSD